LRPAGRLEADDFKRRELRLPPLDRAEIVTRETSLLAQWRLSYTRKCIVAAHAVLDMFTNMETARLRRLAAAYFPRPFYALRFLCQLSFQIWASGSEDVVSLRSLKLDFYIEALARLLSAASGGGLYKVPQLWLYALQSRIQPWYDQFCLRIDTTRRADVQGPGRVTYPLERTSGYSEPDRSF
jgi:hypothetical protein